MSTNPNNAIGTNGAFGGRTSVNAFNDVMGALSRGVLSGWACVPNSGLTVSLGGNGTTRDTAIAEDNAGNRTSINNISNSPINVTIGAAPGTNSRIDAIVAYVDNPPSGVSTVTDNPGACGLIVVEGTAASTPVAPNDTKIRTAITADGASGTTAYYVVLAYVTMASGTTDITASEITAGATAQANNNIVSTDSIADKSVTADKIDLSTLSGNYSYTEINTGYTWTDGKPIYKKTIDFGALPNSTSKAVEHGIVNLELAIKYDGVIKASSSSLQFTLPFASNTTTADNIQLSWNSNEITISTNASYWAGFDGYITLYYTKSS